MGKTEIILSVIATTSIVFNFILIFILYKSTNKNGQVIKYIDVNNK